MSNGDITSFPYLIGLNSEYFVDALNPQNSGSRAVPQEIYNETGFKININDGTKAVILANDITAQSILFENLDYLSTWIYGNNKKIILKGITSNVITNSTDEIAGSGLFTKITSGGLIIDTKIDMLTSVIRI